MQLSQQALEAWTRLCKQGDAIPTAHTRLPVNDVWIAINDTRTVLDELQKQYPPGYFDKINEKTLSSLPDVRVLQFRYELNFLIGNVVATLHKATKKRPEYVVWSHTNWDCWPDALWPQNIGQARDMLERLRKAGEL